MVRALNGELDALLEAALACSRGEDVANARRALDTADAAAGAGACQTPTVEANFQSVQQMRTIVEDHSLVVAAINSQCMAGRSQDSATELWDRRRVLASSPPPDVICVQEGFEGVSLVDKLSYHRIASSSSHAKPYREMVYSDMAALCNMDEACHDRLVVHEIYLRTDNDWAVVDAGATQISSDVLLKNGIEPRSEQDVSATTSRPLSVRSLVWAKFRNRHKVSGPHVVVLSARLTGGSFEDGFFSSELVDERCVQVERILDLYNIHAAKDDVGILVGDFGTTLNDAQFLSASTFSATPELENRARCRVAAPGSPPEELKHCFKRYKSAPIDVLQAHDWQLAHCQPQVPSVPGLRPCSIHLATSRPVAVRMHLCHGMDLSQAPIDQGALKATVVLRRPASDESARFAAPVFVGDAMNRVFSKLSRGEMDLRTRLQCEWEELDREHLAEREGAAEIQAELSAEMRELRNRCQEQGQHVGMLMQRLSDARSAVTAELQSEAAVRAALGGELMSEESQRKHLEAARKNEEAEALGRAKVSEEQLSTLASVRTSLEAQLKASARVQEELVEHIEAERRGRSELEVAGKRELSAWSEHNNEIYAELQYRIKAERAEVDTWRTTLARESSRLRQESSQHADEEGSLRAQLATMREWRLQVQSKLQAEACAWQHEVEELRTRARYLGEECENRIETVRLCDQERSEYLYKCREVKDDLHRCEDKARLELSDAKELDQKLRSRQTNLDNLRKALQKCENDEDAGRLGQECRDFRDRVDEQKQRRQELEEEHAKAKGFRCWRRRPAAPPLPPPSTPPPRTDQASAAQQEVDSAQGIETAHQQLDMQRFDDSKGEVHSFAPGASASTGTKVGSSAMTDNV